MPVYVFKCNIVLSYLIYAGLEVVQQLPKITIT